MEDKRYKIGETVMYGSNGICVVEDIQKMMFPYETAEKTYYVLKPLSIRNSKLFVPEDNELLMSKVRRLLTKEEIDAAISENSGEADKWIEDKNARFAYFNSVIKAADPVKLLSAIKCIYRRKGEIEGSGKKLSSADENVLLTAEKLVKGEFAYILGIEEDAVADYIQSKA
jgi:CarD family transcriptional regulator